MNERFPSPEWDRSQKKEEEMNDVCFQGRAVWLWYRSGKKNAGNKKSDNVTSNRWCSVCSRY